MRRSETPPEKLEGGMEGGTDTNQMNGRSFSDRRGFLKLAGVSAVALGGTVMGSTSVIGSTVQIGEGGPPDPDNWTLNFEDTFDGGELDTSTWGIGWGWGTNSSASDAQIAEENVDIDGSTLQLSGTHDGNNVYTGGINTKDSVEFGPGSYVEAKLGFPNRIGFNPGFWGKPTTEDWPPELDIVEVIQDGSGRDDTHTSRHFIHYSVSTEPGDTSTHERVSAFYEPGDDLTENFHVFGAEWQSDRIAYYVDGQEVQTWTDSTILESFRRGAPFYINLINNINVDSELNDVLGQADLSEPWGDSLDVDWIRVWQQ